MQRFIAKTNIPMEILRTVVTVAETGSLSRAAAQLNLSQPAVSAQLKKIESLVGGCLFKKSSSGSALTELGKLALVQARRAVEANDQFLRLRGDTNAGRSVRFGISNLYVESLFERISPESLREITIVSDHSAALLTSLVSGFLDAVLAIIPSDIDLDLTVRKLNERELPLTWVKAQKFVLSPGAPVPLLTWSGQVSNELMTRALEDAGMTYRIAFSSPDHHAILAAARAGTGLIVLPADMPLSGLVHANDYYLPPIKPAKLSLCARMDGDASIRSKILNAAANAFFESAEDRSSSAIPVKESPLDVG